MKKSLLSVIVLLALISSGGFFVRDNQNISVDIENVSEKISSSAELEWIPPKEIISLKLFLEYDPEETNAPSDFSESDETKYYQVGKILSGKYEDSEIILVITPSVMGDPSVLRFIKKGSDVILLNKYSDEIVQTDFINPHVTIETPADLLAIFAQAFDLPEEIPVKNAKLRFHWKTPVFFSEKNLVPVSIEGEEFSYLNGRLFMESNQKNTWEESDDGLFQSNGFFLRMPDNTTALYNYDIPFFDPDAYLSSFEHMPHIKWKSGNDDKSFYAEGAAEYSGCGIGKNDFARVVFDTINVLSFGQDDFLEIPFSEVDLEISGYTTTDSPVYSFKDKKHPVLRDYYDKFYIPFWKDIEWSVVTYDEFVKSTPFFFWDDPFGRRIMFINTSYLMPSGCGAKPVIYLYPQKTEDISVKLKTSRKTFVSKPEYNNGWNVTADPQSNILDLASQMRVPYLFWEDTLTYKAPEQGFVVRKEDVDNFLSKKLTFVGLNEKEISEFKEFWLPKMQENPFYFITFLQTEAMNTIAPLEIEPKPNTVIRIFMHFDGLSQAIEVEPLLLQAHDREGFTVVEWGGRLQ